MLKKPYYTRSPNRVAFLLRAKSARDLSPKAEKAAHLVAAFSFPTLTPEAGVSGLSKGDNVYKTENRTPTLEKQYLLFCQTSQDLTRLEREARSKLAPLGNGYRAVQFADRVVEIVKRRHHHAARCEKCLVSEALASR